jgi:hypothetical protein
MKTFKSSMNIFRIKMELKIHLTQIKEIDENIWKTSTPIGN